MKKLLLLFLLLPSLAFAGPPSAPQAGGSGDVTDVYDCASGDCNSVALSDGDLLDMSSVSVSATTEGIILPQHATDCSSAGTAEGQVCWEADADTLYIGDGATVTQVSGGNVSDNTAEAITGVWEIQDDTAFNLGNDADWTLRYDETAGDQLEIYSTNAGADTTIDIQNTDATYKANLTVDGDITADAFLSGAGDGNHKINVANTTTCSALDTAGDLCYDADATNGAYWLYYTADDNNALITSDSGVVKLLGTGGTNNEDLTIDLETTANAATLSTSTGVTEINSTLQIVTTGDIMGAINISSKTAATYTVGTDDAHESYGTLFINGDNDAIDFTLPSAVAGMSACFMQGQGAAGAITVQPNTGDYLVVDGVRGTAATDYASSGAAGDKICIIAMDATDWIVTSESGTWSE